MLATGGLGYHLWFLPAFCICMILTVFLRRFMRWRGIFATGCVLYVLGLAIGSYSGLISSLPEEHAGMRLAIARGGPFYGTIFVILGLWLGAGHWRIGMRSSVLLYLAGLVSSLTEAYLLATHHFMLFGNNDFLIGTLLMGFGAFSIALNLPNRGNIVRGIGRFGAYTMGIYAVHPIVLIALKSLLHPVGFFSNFYIAIICNVGLDWLFGGDKQNKLCPNYRNIVYTIGSAHAAAHWKGCRAIGMTERRRDRLDIGGKP